MAQEAEEPHAKLAKSAKNAQGIIFFAVLAFLALFA